MKTGNLKHREITKQQKHICVKLLVLIMCVFICLPEAMDGLFTMKLSTEFLENWCTNGNFALYAKKTWDFAYLKREFDNCGPLEAVIDKLEAQCKALLGMHALKVGA
jgi:hypothetical protein